MNESQNIFASANKKSTVRILKKIQAAISAQELRTDRGLLQH